MKLLQMYDGFAVVAINWEEMKLVVNAFDALDVGQVETWEHSGTLQAAFEALMFAGKLQTEVGDVTLRQFRREHGLYDWQPHLVLHDVDDAKTEAVAAS